MRGNDWMARLIYLDDAVIAVAKPPGLLTHPGGWSPDRYTVMLALRSLFGHHVFPLHRLDRPTSGVLLFARSSAMARMYRSLFEESRLRKTYLAVVRGWPPESGIVDRALSCPETGRIQSARTTYRLVAKTSIDEPMGKFPTGRFALLKVTPESGRWHQIRRHLNGIAHPVVGDSTHGDTRFNRYAREQVGVDRLMLHAAGLEYVDPRGHGARTFEAPLETDMDQLFERFKWSSPASWLT